MLCLYNNFSSNIVYICIINIYNPIASLLGDRDCNKRGARVVGIMHFVPL